MFAAVNASASARAATVARAARNSAPAPRAASFAYAQAAFTRSWLLNFSRPGSRLTAQSRRASNNASSGKQALANAQALFAISREDISLSVFAEPLKNGSAAHASVSAPATLWKSFRLPASSPPTFALACAHATFASARASKAPRAHSATEAEASVANRDSSKKSRLANAQLEAATSRAVK